MSSLEQFADDRLAHGRLYFTRAEVLASLALKPPALAASITRMINKRKLANHEPLDDFDQDLPF